jgi:hypothetical protein
MPCEHYKDALIEVAASGSAPSGELRAHLDWCASCRAAFDEEQSLFSAIDSSLHASVNADVPSSLLPRVRARLDEAVTTQPRWMHPLVLVSAGVALASLLVLVIQPHRSVPDNVAKQTPAAPTREASTMGTHKGISPSKIQITSSAVNHSHAPRNSTLVHSVASSNPEVLVPPDEREALARFVAVLNDRGSLAAALLAPAEKRDALLSLDPVQIKDLEVKPLEGTESEASDGAGEKR